MSKLPLFNVLRIKIVWVGPHVDARSITTELEL
jgi:hypothetical protein